MVFILWGANAGAKKDLILRAQAEPAGGSVAGMPAKRRHLIIQAPHPSPLSAYRGFFGCRHFSQCNEFLKTHGETPVDWQL
jgi:uracil-DNA glycosylase